jgi:hypothetical protein
MEAYCNEGGTPSTTVNSNGRSPRPVTKRDYDKLSQQNHLLNTMDTLHESKINVLRGTQEQRAMALMTKNENTLEKLADDCRAEREEIEACHQGEEIRLANMFTGKKCRMIMRWKLQEEIERKKLEKDSGLMYGPLPPLTFPELPIVTSDGVVVETPTRTVEVTPAVQPVSVEAS